MVEDVLKRDLCAFIERWDISSGNGRKGGVSDVEFVKGEQRA